MEIGSKQFQAVRESMITTVASKTSARLQPTARSLVQGSLVWNHQYAITKGHVIITLILYRIPKWWRDRNPSEIQDLFTEFAENGFPNFLDDTSDRIVGNTEWECQVSVTVATRRVAEGNSKFEPRSRGCLIWVCCLVSRGLLYPAAHGT